MAQREMWKTCQEGGLHEIGQVEESQGDHEATLTEKDESSRVRSFRSEGTLGFDRALTCHQSIPLKVVDGDLTGQ